MSWPCCIHYKLLLQTALIFRKGFKKMWNYSCCGIFSALQFMKLRVGLHYNVPIKTSFIAISVCYREECGLTVVQILSRRKSLKWTIGIVKDNIWNYLWLWSVLSGSQSRALNQIFAWGLQQGMFKWVYKVGNMLKWLWGYQPLHQISGLHHWEIFSRWNRCSVRPLSGPGTVGNDGTLRVVDICLGILGAITVAEKLMGWRLICPAATVSWYQKPFPGTRRMFPFLLFSLSVLDLANRNEVTRRVHMTKFEHKILCSHL